jgi:transcriptional regulator with XRE-family HTH domain
MIKEKIIKLCELKKITVKRLSIEIQVSEPTIYRWFKDDSLDLKYLRRIAEYFKQDLSYFFSKEDPTYLPVNVVQEKKVVYESNFKDKYIEALESLTRLQKENTELKEQLTWYEVNCDCAKTKQAGAKMA